MIKSIYKFLVQLRNGRKLKKMKYFFLKKFRAYNYQVIKFKAIV
jgi:hypothetical protein